MSRSSEVQGHNVVCVKVMTLATMCVYEVNRLTNEKVIRLL